MRKLSPNFGSEYVRIFVQTSFFISILTSRIALINKLLYGSYWTTPFSSVFTGTESSHERSLKFYMKLGSAHIARFVWRKRQTKGPIYQSGFIIRSEGVFQKIAWIVKDVDGWLEKASFILCSVSYRFIISCKTRLSFVKIAFWKFSITDKTIDICYETYAKWRDQISTYCHWNIQNVQPCILK